MASSEISVVTPSLRSLGNIVTGSDHQTEAVIQAGGLPTFAALLQHSKMNIVKEAAWTLSNITAGTPEQIQSVIDSGCLGPLVEVLAHGDFKAKKEAAWAITNLTSGMNFKAILISNPYCCFNLSILTRWNSSTNRLLVSIRSNEALLRIAWHQ